MVPPTSSPRRGRLGADLIGLAIVTAGPRLAMFVVVLGGLAMFGTATMGTVFTAEATAFYAQIAGGAFLLQYGAQFVAERDGKRIKEVWGLYIALSCVVAAIMACAALVAGAHQPGLWLAASTTVIAMAVNPVWALRGHREFENFLKIVALQVGVQWVCFGVFFFAFRSPAWYFLATSVASALAFLTTVAATSVRPTMRSWKHLPASRHLAGSSLAIQSYTSADLLMVSAIRGRRAAGLYGTAYKYHNAVMSVYALAVQVLLPRYTAIKRVSPSDANQVGIYFGSLWISLSAVVAATGRPWLPPQYKIVATLLAVLSIQAGAAYAAMVPALELLVSRQRAYLVVTAIAAAVNLTVNLILIPTVGLVGAASATALSEWITLVATRRAAHIRGRMSLMPLALAVLVVPGGLGVSAWIPAAASVTFAALLIRRGLPAYAELRRAAPNQTTVSTAAMAAASQNDPPDDAMLGMSDQRQQAEWADAKSGSRDPSESSAKIAATDLDAARPSP